MDKKFSNSLVIQEMQIKTVRYFISTRLTTIKTSKQTLGKYFDNSAEVGSGPTLCPHNPAHRRRPGPLSPECPAQRRGRPVGNGTGGRWEEGTEQAAKKTSSTTQVRQGNIGCHSCQEMKAGIRSTLPWDHLLPNGS